MANQSGDVVYGGWFGNAFYPALKNPRIVCGLQFAAAVVGSQGGLISYSIPYTNSIVASWWFTAEKLSLQKSRRGAFLAMLCQNYYYHPSLKHMLSSYERSELLLCRCYHNNRCCCNFFFSPTGYSERTGAKFKFTWPPKNRRPLIARMMFFVDVTTCLFRANRVFTFTRPPNMGATFELGAVEDLRRATANLRRQKYFCNNLPSTSAPSSCKQLQKNDHQHEFLTRATLPLTLQCARNNTLQCCMILSSQSQHYRIYRNT